MVKVAILRGSDPQDITFKALEMVEGERVIAKEKPILIKPNYLNSKHPSTGITTDGRVIEGVIKFFKKHKKAEIIVGEGSGFSNTFDAYKNAGVDIIAEKYKIKLIDLNKDDFIETKLKDPLNLKKVKIANSVLNSTIISVPKLKPHRIAGVSLSIKNMMGAMTPKGSMHSRLSKNIADLASIIKPELAVIDGIIAGEGHESSGEPLKMDLVIAGLDPVAVDAVGASVIGIDPNDVKHLIFAEKQGLGTMDLDQIEILGEKIESVQKKFKRSVLSKFLVHLG